MKKIFVILATVLLGAATLSAQDMAQATETYNNGAAALNLGDKAGALSYFEQALQMAAVIGADADEIAANCKNVIPSLHVSLAKETFKDGDIKGAIAKLEEAIKIANEYDAPDAAADAAELIPQFKMKQGTSLITAKDYAGAIVVFQDLLAADETNGTAALRLGQCFAATGKLDEAIAAFEKAAANGQEAQANKQLGNITLKQAASALKGKKFADAVTAALKSYEYSANPQALQIAGQASQLQNKNADAIKYFEQYLEAAPTAKNAGQIAYTVGAIYQQQKNNAKAKEFYSKAVSDPTYGAQAKALLEKL